MNSDESESKVTYTPGSASTNTSQPAVQEPMRQKEEDAMVHTAAKLLPKSPPETEDDSTEQSQSSLPSWTIQGYKVST